MLRALTRTIRRRVGRVLALAYLACVIMPPVALAFADGAVAAHCLTDDHHMTAAVPAAVHVHADGSTHHHAAPHERGSPQRQSDKPGKAHPANCCGLFCVTATTTEIGVQIAPPPRGRMLAPVLQAAIAGHGPDRIDRPPIILVSL
jgi:hypothetical protein